MSSAAQACADGLAVVAGRHLGCIFGRVRDDDGVRLSGALKVEEVARLLHASPETVRRLCSRGVLRCERVPGRGAGGIAILIPLEEVRRLLLEYPGRTGYGAGRTRRGGKPWTADEIALLLSGLSVGDLAARLGRSRRSVVIKRCRLRRRMREGAP